MNKTTYTAVMWTLLIANMCVGVTNLYLARKRPPAVSVPEPLPINITVHPDYDSLRPCDISSGDDWCDPYIDWGYANGVVMVQRTLGEQEWFKSLCTDPRQDLNALMVTIRRLRVRVLCVICPTIV